MKVGLNVGERLIVLSVLPREGSVVTLKLIRELISRLGITTEEFKDFEIVEAEGTVKWNLKGAVPIEFEFDDKELELIRKELRSLEHMDKLKMEMLPVYEKFCS